MNGGTSARPCRSALVITEAIRPVGALHTHPQRGRQRKEHHRDFRAVVQVRIEIPPLVRPGDFLDAGTVLPFPYGVGLQVEACEVIAEHGRHERGSPFPPPTTLT